MDEKRHKVILRRFYLTFATIALVVYLLLMAFVLPWWDASNHPVMVTLGAGSAQDIRLAYAEDEEPLKLVPVGDPEGYHWFWGTELPPRPKYELALVFPEGTAGEVILKDIKIIDLAETKETHSMIVSGLEEPADGSVRVRQGSKGQRLQAQPGGILPFDLELPSPSPFDWLAIWFKATLGYLFVSLILLMTLATFLRFPDGIHAFRKKTPPVEVLIFLICCTFGALIHVYLVRHSMPVFSVGESESYLLEAMAVKADGSSIESQALLPAYPAFLAGVSRFSSWDLSNHSVVQATLFSLSLLLLGFSLVRFIQGYIIGPVILLAMISPPVLWASRNIGVESLLSSAWLASLAAFILYWQRDGWLRWVAMILFSAAALVAASISSVGLVLYLLPTGLMVGTIWWTIAVRGKEFWKMTVLWRALSQAVVPFIVLISGSLYFGVVDPSAADICAFPRPSPSAPFASGMVELRAVEDTPAYPAIINERAANGFIFDGPAMQQFPDLADASYAALPLQARLVAWGRLSGWALFLPDITTGTRDPLKIDYRLRTQFRSSAQADRIRDAINRIMRQSGIAVHVMEKWSNRQVVNYNQIVIPIYQWFYRVLLFAAVAGWLIGLAERKYLAAVLVLPFLLKVLLHILSFDVSSEYIQSLDACLWLGALAGLLCVNPKAMQKRTDESDRRCMPPIRPKELMTRHKGVPGTQTQRLDH